MTCVRFMAAPLLLCAFAGCSALPSAPIRPVVYDFGPGTLQVPAKRAPVLPPIVLPAIKAPPALDTAAVLYRLGYADPQQLRPYAQARWSMPPAQLVRQRLSESLHSARVVVDPGETAIPLVLRLELQEYSQLFDSEQTSSGLVRMRATLLEAKGGADRPIAQQLFIVQRPAPTPDAAGGVRALMTATDAAIEQIATWLKQQAPR
jgi:cholesterol transport system auxiliary component